ncbi:MAG: hypothetical protein ABIH99_04445 [Candidatus Micrarchaeota archaeon]
MNQTQARAGSAMPCRGALRSFYAETIRAAKEANQFEALVRALERGSEAQKEIARERIVELVKTPQELKELANTRSAEAWEVIREFAGRGGAWAHVALWQAVKVRSWKNAQEIDEFSAKQLARESAEVRENYQKFFKQMVAQNVRAGEQKKNVWVDAPLVAILTKPSGGEALSYGCYAAEAVREARENVSGAEFVQKEFEGTTPCAEGESAKASVQERVGLGERAEKIGNFVAPFALALRGKIGRRREKFAGREVEVVEFKSSLPRRKRKKKEGKERGGIRSERKDGMKTVEISRKREKREKKKAGDEIRKKLHVKRIVEAKKLTAQKEKLKEGKKKKMQARVDEENAKELKKGRKILKRVLKKDKRRLKKIVEMEKKERMSRRVLRILGLLGKKKKGKRGKEKRKILSARLLELFSG